MTIAGAPRDIGNSFFYVVLQVVLAGIVHVPRRLTRRIYNFSPEALCAKSAAQQLRCFERGADVIEATLALCNERDLYTKGWREYLKAECDINTNELQTMKSLMQQIGARARQLYQCTSMPYLEYLAYVLEGLGGCL